MIDRWSRVATVLWLGAVIGCGGAVGGNDAGIDADAGLDTDAGSSCTGDIKNCLSAISGVASVTEKQASDSTLRWFALEVVQPEDHSAPAGKTFHQLLDILVPTSAGLDAPVVLETTGYEEYQLDTPLEVTSSLDAIQIAMEHRFYGDSIATNPDWTKLTIQQAAADEHEIVVKFRSLFRGHWINTGRSKGGMTAVFHRRFYPNDVEGTLALVAPISFKAPDDRYQSFFDTIGDSTCRERLDALLTLALGSYRADFVANTTAVASSQGLHFSTFTPAQALEETVRWIPWSFWQQGDDCASLPDPASVSSNGLWSWLTAFSEPSYYADGVPNDTSAGWPYQWQALTQLGWQAFHLNVTSSLLTDPMDPVASANWTEAYPIAAPVFDASVMRDIQDWVSTSAEHIAFLYGGWDPWTGGMYEVGANTQARDVHRTVIAGQPHHFFWHDMASSDLAALNAQLQAWTGVTPHMPRRITQPYLRLSTVSPRRFGGAPIPR